MVVSVKKTLRINVHMRQYVGELPTFGVLAVEPGQGIRGAP
jgi:hypothetical protein